jgi:antitoxin component of MazEF toxin-antitoxin module
MTKTITKIGNSNGIIFDAAFMDMAHLKTGDQLAVTVHEGGSVILTPMNPKITREDVTRVIKSTMKDYARTMQKLA